jgi:hypothetical protein
MPRQKQDLQRLTVNLSSSQYSEVETRAAAAGVTITRYLQQALALKFLVDEHKITDLPSADGEKTFHLVFA